MPSRRWSRDCCRPSARRSRPGPSIHGPSCWSTTSSLAPPRRGATWSPTRHGKASAARTREMTTSTDIAVRGLAVSFGQARNALSGVELAVRRGEFVALIGASGCGKTTLLNVIAGLVPAAVGTVTIGGTPPAAGRRDICYVLARDALLPWRTVMGNVEYGLELSGVGREERARR